ncbi:helix-turn-helix transcriptional regulator [Lactobacillus crispatus]|uniref:helix-turn-helix domain-containing protein n=1 Tax=Lactobacillus crispatus TaxID=47770 RepID=UPI0030FB6D21
MDRYKTFSDNLQYLMNKKSISRNQLSDATNIPYTTLTSWIKCKSYPRPENLEQLAKFFKRPAYELTEPRQASLQAKTVNTAQQIAGKSVAFWELMNTVDQLNSEDQEKLGQIAHKMLDVESSIKSAVLDDNVNN